jgi:uncharacterized tellurite resistance protein B-like protein
MAGRWPAENPRGIARRGGAIAPDGVRGRNTMLKSISAFLDRLRERDDGEPLEADQIRLATAALLVYTIAIDGRIGEEEMARLKSLLASHFQLEEADVNRLLIEAEQHERQAVDVYRFTSVLRDRLSLEEKREIIAMMWRLVYADGELAPVEDNLVWRVAELIAVPARDRMELKRIVRDEIG